MESRPKTSPNDPTLLRRWRYQTAVQAARMLNATATRDREHAAAGTAPVRASSG